MAKGYKLPDNIVKLEEEPTTTPIEAKSTKPGRGVSPLLILLGFILLAGAVFGGFQLYQTIAKGTTEAPPAEVDDRPLEVRVTMPERTIANPVTEVTVISNKEISMAEHGRASLKYLAEHEGSKYYIIQISKLAVGETIVNVKLHDNSGQESPQQITITRRGASFPAGYNQILPWPDGEYVLDGDDLTAVVNKQHRLLEDYEPADLVDLNKDKGLYTLNNATLRLEAADALKTMLDDLAAATGKYVTIASGYRSYENQVSTYALWVRQLGEQEANTLSAKPGHSEHQLGTTVDFVSDETGWQINSNFGNTVAGKWLAENCNKYGFILPYAIDQSGDGGYKEEAWHFRYVGIDNIGEI